MSTHGTAGERGADHVPVIDVASLIAGESAREEAARAIDRACREHGFFYVTGHGVPRELVERLTAHSREFFGRDVEEKMSIRMALAARAWRGYFPVGAELTSGVPDRKEGLYFGAELGDDHPLVRAGTPIHGRNLFPAIPGFRETVLEYIDALTRLGHHLMAGVALGLGLPGSYFADRYTRDPLILFRIFNYPRASAAGDEAGEWGVGEHTDYGLLTILAQDDVGGLQVRTPGGWIDAPPLADTFICNIGDMLDRMTRGTYRSTPHRVVGARGRDRLSFPFFFDPNFNARVGPIEGLVGDPVADDRNERWDRASVHEFDGTYGEYLLKKVGRVFPELLRDVI